MKTNKAKNFIGMLAIAGASLLTVNIANATCNPGSLITGGNTDGWVNVIAVYEYSISGATYGYIHVVPEHSFFQSYDTYFYTNNQQALTQAKLAFQNHQSLSLIGDAASCPSTGSFRYGGALQNLYIY
jgi:hypothetical protein